MIPEFAVLGHPNEGKSSVLSTLAEDDTVRISPEPGETVECRTFPVRIDNREVIRFTDTPGFQNPRRMLAEIEKLAASEADPLECFYQRHHSDPALHHDCELLRPLLRGAGIIYVADGSRPVRSVDLAEMEILRLSGKPRMAILNCKESETTHLDQWKNEFRKHFNSSRLFNAHNATYRERIRLLEALKAIEQDWQETLEYVVAAFKEDWQARTSRTADILCEMLQRCCRLQMEKTVGQSASPAGVQEELYRQYLDRLRRIEREHHKRMRTLYKHNVFDYDLPPQSILNHDLFSDETWEFLGLRSSQLILVGGASGAALAAGLDLAAGGASLGLFTSIGGALGALGAIYGSRNLAARVKLPGIDAGRTRLRIGPNKNPQFPYILLDRALLYYNHIINWAHGRRDYAAGLPEQGSQRGLSGGLPRSSLRRLDRFFKALQQEGRTLREEEEEAFKEVILELLDRIANAEEDETDPDQ